MRAERVTDEYVRAFVELWTKDAPKFDGKHVRFSNIGFDPKPVQKPHPPIWVGGESGPALRRTARIGDAWYPIGTNPQNPLDSLTRFKTQAARLRKMVTEAGRDPKAVGLTLRVTVFGETAPPQASDGEHRLFAGRAGAACRRHPGAARHRRRLPRFRFRRVDGRRGPGGHAEIQGRGLAAGLG